MSRKHYIALLFCVPFFLLGAGCVKQRTPASASPNLRFATAFVQSEVVEEVIAAHHEPLEGDVNEDGCVSIADFAIIQNEFNQCGENLRADLNGDGCVTISDFSKYQNSQGKGPCCGCQGNICANLLRLRGPVADKMIKKAAERFPADMFHKYYSCKSNS